MPVPIFSSSTRYPITLKPITKPADKEIYADIFNVLNTLRQLFIDLDTALAEFVQEAPEDGIQYGRQDGEWTPIEPGIEEAPEDGQQYARKDAEWVVVESEGGGIPEAPEDGLIYGRKDASWVEVSGGGGSAEWGDITGNIADQADLQLELSYKEPAVIPGSLNQYYRGDKTWQELDWAAIADKPAIPAAQVNSDWNAVNGVAQILNKPAILPDAPADGKLYARKDNAWKVIPTTATSTVVEILARNMSPSASGGATAFAVAATGANQPDIHSLAFNASTQQHAQFSITLPPELLPPAELKFKIRWSHPAATSYGIVWGLQAVAIGDDAAIAVDYGTAVEVYDSGGTTNDLYITDVSGVITIAGSPDANKPVFFRVYRKAAAAADTLNVAGRLHSILLTTEYDPPPPGGVTTWNPMDKGSNVVLSNGNLTAHSTTYIDSGVRSVFGTSSGKWYWEIKLLNVGVYSMPGIGTAAATLADYPGVDAFAWGYFPASGEVYHNAAIIAAVAAANDNHIIGFALNLDAGTLRLYVNGVDQGIVVTGISGKIYAMWGDGASTSAGCEANFGQNPFIYPVPAGYTPGFGAL